eukprot:3269901-Prymnesium_polylepis.2
MSNMSDRPRTNMAASQPAPIDVLSQEVEEMEMNEQRQLDMEYAHNHHNAQQQRVEQELEVRRPNRAARSGAPRH